MWRSRHLGFSFLILDWHRRHKSGCIHCPNLVAIGTLLKTLKGQNYLSWLFECTEHAKNELNCSILAANSGNQKICCFIIYNIHGKCLGFARIRNDDRRRIIIIIIIIIIISTIIIMIRIKPSLKIVNECRSLTGLGRIKPSLKIVNECRSLTGLGGIKPSLKIFHECRSLTGLGRIKPSLKIVNECSSLTGLERHKPSLKIVNECIEV